MEQTLESVAGLDEQTGADVALDILQQTSSLLNSYLDETKIDQCVQAILPACRTRGILCYIDCHLATRVKDEHEKAKVEAIKILQNLLSDSRFHVFVGQVCHEIYKTIRLLVPREFESSSCQLESIQGLILLVENFADRVIKEEEKSELKKLYEGLLTAQEKSKFSATVRGKILECLGVLGPLGRKSFLGGVKARLQLMEVFTRSLKGQVESSNKKMEASIILGAVKGMDKFLKAFKDDISKEHESLTQFYDNLEKIVDPKCSIANDGETEKVIRREFQRAGLHFVANHAEFLKENFLENHERWFDDLLMWSKSSNQDDSKSGIRAIMKFLVETKAYAEHLNNVATRTHLDKVNAFAQFLAGRINAIMDNTESTKTELRIAVKSAGLLASVCENAELMEALFTKIMQHIEAIIIELNMDSVDKYKSSPSLIHTFVESAGSILLAMKISDSEAREAFESRLHIVESLCILLVTYYPELRENFRYFAPGSFLKVVCGLYDNHRSYCGPFLDRIIHEGLTHIIASPTEAEAEILVEADNQLNSANSRDSSRSGESVYNRLGIRTVKFYTEFWTGLTGSPEAQETPVAEMIYNKVVDWILRTIGKLDLSLTFVDNEENPEIIRADPVFGTKASKAKDFQLFINMVDFVTIFVRYSHHQFFSGWIEVFVEKSLEKIELHPLVSGFYRLVALAFEMGSEFKFFPDQNSRIFWLSSSFLQSLGRRIQEFRDDLLLAVLEVWLAAPHQIILQNTNNDNSGHLLGSTLEAVFNAGKSSLVLARRGLYTMQRWFQIPEFPQNLMEQLMNQLFPIWLTYFSASVGEEKERLELKEIKKQQGVRYRRLQTVLGLELKETSRKELQLEILKLIGSYGHFIQAAMDEKCPGFSTQTKSLKYAVPFKDVKPEIFLDDFVPRLMKLCFDSSDRQTRSSACEVFHSYVLYYIGCYGDASKGNTSLEMWRQIFLALVQLGSDSDIVVKQLFNPLTVQAVRWCTAKDHGLVQITLEVIVDGLVQVEDPRRRDFSCICLQEYFEWCWEEKNNEQMVKVVKYLISLSQHAAAQYRQGSVLGFNSIYTKFGEDENLCDLYTFQLLYGFIVSLSLSSEFEETSLMVRSTQRALQHLQRIIQDSFKFNVRTLRQVPAELEGNSLWDIVNWLVMKSAVTWRVCRKECFRLVLEFIPHIQGVASAESYMITLKELWRTKGLMLVAEKSLQMSQPRDNFSHFLSSLEIASDFYAFLKTQFSYPSEKLIAYKKSKFLPALEQLLNGGLDRLQYPPQEAKEHFEKLIAIMLNMSQLEILLPADLEAKIIVSSAILWKMQSETTFKEQPELIDKWKKYWKHCKKAEGILEEFGPKLRQIFKLDLSGDFTINYLKWLGSVAHSGFLVKIFKKKDLVLMFESIWDFIDDLIVRENEDGTLEEKNLSNRDRNAVQLLFNIAVGLGVQSDFMESKIFDTTLIKRSKERVARGELYQDLFASSLPLCPRLLKFSRLVREDDYKSIGKLIQRIILSVKNDSRLRKKCGTVIVENCIQIQIWSQLVSHCTFPVISAMMSGMAVLDMEKCKNARSLADWWCGRQMMMDPTLPVKEKSNFVHFLGLFAQTTDPELLGDVLSTTHEMLLTTLTSNVNWAEEENYIVKILQAVLNVFELVPGNLDVIRIIVLVVAQVAVICESNENDCSVAAKKRLVKIVPAKLDYSVQFQVLNTVYDLVMGEGSDLYRRTVAASKYCLVPLVSSVSERAAKMFYLEYINHLQTCVDKEPSNIPEACQKITAANLLEVLCIRKWRGGKLISDPELNKKYLQTEKLGQQSNDGKECANSLITACSKFKLMSAVTDPKMKKLLLEANQAGFNVVLAGSRFLTTPPKEIVDLVVEFQGGNSAEWENVIDCENDYELPVELDSSGKADLDEKSKDSEPLMAAVMKSNARAARKYGLINSSLSMEATLYDFTADVTVEDSKYYQKIFGETDNSSNGNNAEATLINGFKVNLEWSLVNQHPCMLPYVEALKNLDAKKSIPENADIMTRVVDEINSRFLNKPAVHRNIKIFQIGAILNCKNIFAQHASTLCNSVVKLIADQVLGAELNYFIKDVLVMLLEWKEIDIPDKEQVKKLLEFYLRKVSYHRKDIMGQNLELLEVIVRDWVQESGTIPHPVVVEVLEGDSKTGLEICKCLLRGGKLPFKIQDRDNFLGVIGKTFDGTSKVEWRLAGQVVGLALKNLEEMEDKTNVDEAEKYFHGSVMDSLSRKPLVFFTALKSIQENFPRIVKPYRQVALSSLSNKYVGVEALRTVAAILKIEKKIDESDAGVNSLEDFYTDLKGRHLFDSPCRTTETLEAAVEILEGFIEEIKDERKVISLVEWASGAASSEDSTLRARYASAVSKFYFGFGDMRSTKELSVQVHQIFLTLYYDEDPKVSQIVHEFWHQNLQEWKHTPSLFLQLLEILAADNRNPNQIHIVIDLVIKRCSSSPDFNKSEFSDLGECDFKKYNVDTSSHMRNVSFQPLYAETWSSLTNFGRLPKTLQNTLMSQHQATGKLGMNLLKATLAPKRFTPTAPSQYSMGSSSLDDTSIRFGFNSQIFYGDQTPSPSEEDTSGLAHLRKRFYPRPTSDSFAGRQMTKTEALLQRKLQAAKVKRSSVKLVREYRIGELPDVKIKNEDFLKMISLMAKVDPELGRAFVVQMFTSILNDPQVNAKSSNLQRDASRTFTEILKSHESDSELSPQFAAAIIEISVLSSQDSFIPPSLVSATVKRYELHKLGILLFEKFMEGVQLLRSKDPKRAKLGNGHGEDTPEANVLLRIAELYKDLEDFDSVPNVFRMAQEKSEDEKSKEFYRQGCEALKLESEKKYGDSLEIYRGLYKEELEFEGKDERRLEFWQASIHKCLTHQSDWTQLYNECQDSIQSFEGDNELDNPQYLHLVLPTQLAAATQILVRDLSEGARDDVKAASVFIKNLAKHEPIFQIFMTDTADIAVRAAVVKHETGSVSSCIDKCLAGSLKTMQTFHRLSKSKKESLILTLERIALLEDFIVWQLRMKHKQDIESTTKALLLKWERAGRPKSTSLCAADILVAERDLYLRRMKTTLEDADICPESKHNLVKQMMKINENQHLWLASLSLNDSNPHICKKALKKVKEMSEVMEDGEMKAERLRLSCKYDIEFSHEDRWSKQWASRWKKLGELVEDQRGPIVLEAQCTHLQALWLKICENQQLIIEDDKIRDALRVPREADLRQHILDITLKMARFITTETPEASAQDSGMNLQIYRLLKIMREKIGLLANQAPPADADVDKYMLISLLRAMEGENQEALFIFPTTFQILESRPSLLSTFSQHVKSVPSWMFLPWLDQIVVNYTYNQTLKTVLEQIIDRLLKDYPQAFQLQYVDLMKRKYQSELPSKFAEALEAVCMPWIYFKEELTRKGTVEEMTSGLTKFFEKARLVLKKLKKPARVRAGSEIFGSFHQNYINKVMPMVEKFLDKLETEPAGSLSKEIWENFGEPIEKVSAKICEAKRRGRDDNFSLSLEELSPWLANFRSSSYADYIEAPGLYCNFKKPNLHSHPKLVFFDPIVTVMHSLSCPVKLTAMCDNGKLKSYLVKRGDDLRQDKRIQQVFLVANKLFIDDPQCRRRLLHVISFAVIPMGKSFGLIEWVDNVVSLKGMMLQSKQLKEIQKDTMIDWSEWMEATFDPRRSILPNPYNVHAQIFGRTDAVRKLEEFERRLPSNQLMRDHLLQGSSSLGDFFDLRQRMIRSYGSMCIVHWILGIGDRHLDNSLISKETGEFLGIDFGRAFGTAVFMQNPPELIPFRLTPQIQNFLSPYGSSGILKETMLRCFQPLKKSSELLSAVVDVFLHEPARDWLLAKKRNSSPGDASEDSQNLGTTAIRTFKRKLSGHNPVAILSDEIQMMRPESLKPVYTNILKDGRGALGLPSTLPDDQYVEMLISIAADKNILSRLFRGWAPWI